MGWPKRLVFIGITFGALACSKFQKMMKSPDAKVRYRAAVEYYNKKDYYRAGQLLEDILPVLSGSIEAEDANFMYAYCHYHQEQYTLAAYYFKTFVTTYGRSPRAEEALFMRAYCLYKNTPDYNLDQSDTDEAIDAFQDYITRYGDSERSASSEWVEKANFCMKELRTKLEIKAFEIAKQYLKLQYYKAAITALENFTKDFPDSEFVEQAEYLIISARYALASRSMEHLKEERFRAVLNSYYEFAEKYPSSKFLKNAENVYLSARKQIESIPKSNN
ncbi:MAG: outer membrane protein assembly factor BamD [Cytophagales bacterium]|nr:outer membrane protein assembly factor BamD [Cytophagales bacterium]